MNIEIRPIKENEINEFESCITRSFSKDKESLQTPSFVKQFSYFRNTRKDIRWALVLDDKIVSALMIFPQFMKIEEITFSLIGLTGVATLPEFRHKGYAKKLILYVHEYFQKLGFDGATLQSAADNLYRNLGYEFTFGQLFGETKNEENNSHKKNTTNQKNKKNSWLSNLSMICSKYNLNSNFNFRYRIEYYSTSDISNELIEDILQIRKKSPNFINRKVKLLRSMSYMKGKLIEFLESFGILSLLYREEFGKISQKFLGYCLAKIENESLSIIEIHLQEETTSNYCALFEDLLAQFPSQPKKIKFLMYPEDKFLRAFVKMLNGNEYRVLYDKKMIFFFNPLKTMQKMIPVLNNRWNTFRNTYIHNNIDKDKSIFQELFMKIKNVPNISKKQNGKTSSINELVLKLELDQLCISVEQIAIDDFEEILTINNEKIIEERILWLELDFHTWEALIMGYLEIGDIEDEDHFKICEQKRNVYKILSRIFPTIEPIWDYFHSF